MNQFHKVGLAVIAGLGAVVLGFIVVDANNAPTPFYVCENGTKLCDRREDAAATTEAAAVNATGSSITDANGDAGGGTIARPRVPSLTRAYLAGIWSTNCDSEERYFNFDSNPDGWYYRGWEGAGEWNVEGNLVVLTITELREAAITLSYEATPVSQNRMVLKGRGKTYSVDRCKIGSGPVGPDGAEAGYDG